MSSKRHNNHPIEPIPSRARVVHAPSPSDEPTIHATHDSDRPYERDHEPTNDDPRSTPHAQFHAGRSTTHENRSPIHAHAHAHAHDEAEPDAPPTSGSFPHEKLDVYRVALELAALAKKLADRIPRGHRSLADHLLRAASNTVLLYAEGANRRGAALKRQRFVESRGECAEVAAAGDLILVLHIGSQTDAVQLKHLAGRVSAMLTRLIARLG